MDDQNKRLRPIVDALRPLNEGDRKVLASIVADVSKKIQADRGRRCANETWSDAPPGQTAIRASVDSLVWLRVGVGGAAFGHQSGGFLLRLDEGHAVDDHGHVIRVDVPELGGRGQAHGSVLQQALLAALLQLGL